MMSAILLALLPSFLGVTTALAGFPISSVKKGDSLPQGTVPNKFIIEVDSLSDIPTNGKRSWPRSLDAVYSSLQGRGVGFDVSKEFDSAGLFVGASLTLSSPQDAVALANTPGIKAIRPLISFNRPSPVKSVIVTGPTDAGIPADGDSTHILTGVDKLHAQEIFGAGIKIGVIDTGIDYTHPALGAGFGPGHKVIGGYDFVGDNYNGENTPVPDDDPLDQCEGHGTHVAGIIGANPDNMFNISGVAYQASIAAYRVFGCYGSVTDDIVVEALLRGVSDGMDILTMSLAGADGWTEGTATVVASRIAASGKIVTIAAGNDGSSGAWYTSEPGTGIDVISVASLDNTVTRLQNLTVSGVKFNPITYFSTFPLPILGTLPIYATSNDTTVVDDACNPLPDNTPDLSKFVVVARRGTCDYLQKLQNIADKGGNATLFYDDGEGFSGIYVGEYAAAPIQAADGEFLVNEFAAGAKISVSFPQSGASAQFPDPNGGLISSFTSYGPSNDFFFKPSVASPGGNILSTYPVNLGSFAVLSGTSMATPFVAGSAALLLSVKGKSKATASAARTLFETTAKSISSSKTDGDPLQTLIQQGAGLINVFDAIHTSTIVSPGELILNDTAHFKPMQTFTVKNTGTKPKSFKLRHVPAGTALTVRAGTINPASGPVPLTLSTTASVLVTPPSFVLPPGGSQTVVATFHLPSSGVDKSTFPIYSGFIEVVGPSVADTAHVSYIGLGASLKDKKVVDDTDVFFGEKIPAMLDMRGDVQTAPTNYTFVGGDVPTLLWRLVFGTPSLRIDLVDANITFTPTMSVTRRSALPAVPPIFTFPSPHPSGTFASVKILGTIASFNYITRNNESPPPGNGWNQLDLKPAYANGTSVRNGDYRVLVRALKATGNPSDEGDWESWLSPVVGVRVGV